MAGPKAKTPVSPERKIYKNNDNLVWRSVFSYARRKGYQGTQGEAINTVKGLTNVERILMHESLFVHWPARRHDPIERIPDAELEEWLRPDPPSVLRPKSYYQELVEGYGVEIKRDPLIAAHWKEVQRRAAAAGAAPAKVPGPAPAAPEGYVPAPQTYGPGTTVASAVMNHFNGSGDFNQQQFAPLAQPQQQVMGMPQQGPNRAMLLYNGGNAAQAMTSPSPVLPPYGAFQQDNTAPFQQQNGLLPQQNGLGFGNEMPSEILFGGSNFGNRYEENPFTLGNDLLPADQDQDFGQSSMTLEQPQANGTDDPSLLQWPQEAPVHQDLWNNGYSGQFNGYQAAPQDYLPASEQPVEERLVEAFQNFDWDAFQPASHSGSFDFAEALGGDSSEETSPMVDYVIKNNAGQAIAQPQAPQFNRFAAMEAWNAQLGVASYHPYTSFEERDQLHDMWDSLSL